MRIVLRAHQTTANVAGAVALTLNLVGRFDSDGSLPTSVRAHGCRDWRPIAKHKQLELTPELEQPMLLI